MLLPTFTPVNTYVPWNESIRSKWKNLMNGYSVGMVPSCICTHIPLSSATDASTPVLPPRVNPTTKSQVPIGLGDLYTSIHEQKNIDKAIQAHQPWNRCSVRLMVYKELK